MTKIYLSLCISVLSLILPFNTAFAKDSVTIDNVTYSTYSGTTADAEAVDRNVTQLTVKSTVTINGKECSVTNFYINDEFPNLTNLTIPSTLSFFYVNSSYLPKLESYSVIDGNDKFKAENGILYITNDYDNGINMFIPVQYGKPVNVIEGVKSVELQNMPHLKEVSLPASLESINIFDNPELTKITVSPQNTIFASNGKVLTKKNNYDWDKSTKVIFICRDVVTANIPEGVIDLEINETYPMLKTLSLPSTLGSLYINYDLTASKALPELEQITMATKSEVYEAIGGILYSYSQYDDEINRNIELVPTKITTATIAEGVSSVYFENLTNITSVILPSSTQNAQFQNLPQLKSVNAKEGIQYLDIENCPSMSSFNIPASLYNLTIEKSYNIATINLAADCNRFALKDGVLGTYSTYEDYDDEDNLVTVTVFRPIYFLAGTTGYHIANQSDVNIEFYKWPYLTTLTMDAGIDGYQLIDNCLYEVNEYTGNLQLVNAAGGLTCINLPKNIYFRGDSYSPEVFLRSMSKLQSFTVPADNTDNLLVIDNILCRKQLLAPEYPEYSSYEIQALAAPRGISGTVTPFASHAVASDDYRFAGYTIENGCFQECNNITSVDLSKLNGLTIKYGAFQKCENLESVKFNPYSATVEAMAFYEDKKLGNIEFPQYFNLKDASALSGTLWSDNVDTRQLVYAGSSLYYAPSGTTDLVLKEGTTHIAGQSLRSTRVENVTFPSTFMESYENFNNLRTILIKSDQMSYNVNLFSSCNNLESVKVTSQFPPYIPYDYAERVFPYDLSNVTLLVPENFKYQDDKTGDWIEVNPSELYAQATEWSRFGTIEMSGINAPAIDDESGKEPVITANGSEITVTGAQTWSVYTTCGQCVATSTGDNTVTLNPGLYIVRADKTVKKIAIR